MASLKMFIGVLVLVISLNHSRSVELTTSKLITDEETARKFMEELGQEISEQSHVKTLKEWNYVTNLTAENKVESVSPFLNIMK